MTVEGTETRLCGLLATGQLSKALAMDQKLSDWLWWEKTKRTKL